MSYCWLLFTVLGNWRTTQHKNIPRGGFAIIGVTRLIGVRVSIEISYLPLPIVECKIRGALEVHVNMLHCLRVGFLWFVHESTHYAKCVICVRACVGQEN